MYAKSLQSCPTLCDPMDSSPPSSFVHGILQARTLEWVAISFSNACLHAKSLQSCPTLCDPMDHNPPGSSVHGILQVRILEQVCHFLLQGIFPTQGPNPGLLHCRQVLYSSSVQFSSVQSLSRVTLFATP